MKTNNLTIFLVFLSIFFTSWACAETNSIAVVGYIKFANGLGRVTTSWIDMISRFATVNFIDTRPDFTSFDDVPKKVKTVIEEGYAQEADISILTDNIWLPTKEPHVKVPSTKLRFAYSMCESTKAPAPWVDIINDYFDAVLVPDEFLVEVYKNSGVTKPIFVLPLAMYLDNFLSLPLKTQKKKVFTFGICAALSKNKNVEMAIRAFAAEFGNNQSVKLKIHSPWSKHSNNIKTLISSLKVKNIELSLGEKTWKEYPKFFESLDCYVLLSRGEGFSMTVREAMAVGIPCVISDNTAHHTICKSGLVYAVPANIQQPSDREFYNVDVGNNFNCTLSDARIALRTVYNNYNFYLKQSAERRKWAQNYTHEQLLPLYQSLLSPQNIMLSTENTITPNALITDSVELFNKYTQLATGKNTNAPAKKYPCMFNNLKSFGFLKKNHFFSD